MLFNSLAYAVFLPLVFLIYWIIPDKYRWVLLLGSSYFFYMQWNPKYVVLIIFTTLVSYTFARLVEKAQNIQVKRVFVTMTLVSCLGVLFVFKYYNFAAGTVANIMGIEPTYLNLLLPVGISFYTFQTLSYVIDVYRGSINTEKNLGIYATFVIFFPQLVAGPIERSENLLPQIRGKHEFNVDNAYYGVRLILWGLFKKMVVADNLAVYVDQVFGDIYSYSGGSIAIALLFFTIQIYCDFSGYSDIARGSAKILGIELMENFKSPYFATSIRDFWSRWHISLSTWLRDYLYIPLGGNRVSKLRNCMNLMITFLVSGLWHGASWNYIVWGGVHGIAQVYEKAFGIQISKENNIYTGIRRFVVFVFVAYAWVFFRTSNIHEAFYASVAMLQGISCPVEYVKTGFHALGLSRSFVPYLILYLVPIFIFDFFSLRRNVIEWIGERNLIVRHIFAVCLILLLILHGYAGQSAFVYFQF